MQNVVCYHFFGLRSWCDSAALEYHLAVRSISVRTALYAWPKSAALPRRASLDTTSRIGCYAPEEVDSAAPCAGPLLTRIELRDQKAHRDRAPERRFRTLTPHAET